MKKYKIIISCIFILILIVIIYYPVINFDLIDFDDRRYVNSDLVKSGVTVENIKYAFYSFEMANWHPFTWISYMLDVEIWSSLPSGFHITNLIFHILNSILLFIFLCYSTKRIIPSLFTALLFGIHPLHVESVAWVAERKDVLSTFFFILCLFSYSLYVNKKQRIMFYFTIFIFIAGLMSKAILVTFPIVLLIIDYWPLNRLKSEYLFDNFKQLKKNRELLYEKIPFLVLSGICSFLTIVAQKSANAIEPLNSVSMFERTVNAVNAYFLYLYKLLIPINLGVFYPFPSSPNVPLFIISVLTIVLLSFFLLPNNKYPCLQAGWLWYIITMIPVIGIIKVGGQSMADRYTYIPFIGLYICLTFPIKFTQFRSKFIIGIYITIILFFSILCHNQVKNWRNGFVLFKHTINVTKNNYYIHYQIGDLYSLSKDYQKANEHYQSSLDINPQFYRSANGIAFNLYVQGKYTEAINQYKKAIAINPGIDYIYSNLSLSFLCTGNIEEALIAAKTAALLNKNNPLATTIFIKLKKLKNKINEPFLILKNKLTSIDPEKNDFRFELSIIKREKDKLDKVLNSFIKTLSLQPGFSHHPLKKKQIILKKEQIIITKEVYNYYNTLYPLLEYHSNNIRDINFWYTIMSIYAIQKKFDKANYYFKKLININGIDYKKFMSDKNLIEFRAKYDNTALIKKLI